MNDMPEFEYRDVLGPAQSVRLLRARAAELEAQVHATWSEQPDMIRADLALIALLLADVIERQAGG